MKSWWNHRVVRKMDNLDNPDEYSYTIRECYYSGEDDPTILPHSYTDPIVPYGENAEGLVENLRMMLKATEYPVLEETDNGLVRIDVPSPFDVPTDVPSPCVPAPCSAAFSKAPDEDEVPEDEVDG